MSGLSLPQGAGGYRSGSGRQYPPSTRYEEVTLETVVIEKSIGALIDENLAKQSEYLKRHEDIPESFKIELKDLLARIQ